MYCLNDRDLIAIRLIKSEVNALGKYDENNI